MWNGRQEIAPGNKHAGDRAKAYYPPPPPHPQMPQYIVAHVVAHCLWGEEQFSHMLR